MREFLAWYKNLKCKKPPVVLNLSGFLKEAKITKTIESFDLKFNILKRRRVELREMLTYSFICFPMPKNRKDRSIERR